MSSVQPSEDPGKGRYLCHPSFTKKDLVNCKAASIVLIGDQSFAEHV